MRKILYLSYRLSYCRNSNGYKSMLSRMPNLMEPLATPPDTIRCLEMEKKYNFPMERGYFPFPGVRWCPLSNCDAYSLIWFIIVKNMSLVVGISEIAQSIAQIRLFIEFSTWKWLLSTSQMLHNADGCPIGSVVLANMGQAVGIVTLKLTNYNSYHFSTWKGLFSISGFPVMSGDVGRGSIGLGVLENICLAVRICCRDITVASYFQSMAAILRFP